MGRIFMEPLDNPYASLDRLVPPGTPVENGLDAILVDVHAEATSEKYVVGHYCDGRASLVVGTHTHVPTADGPYHGGRHSLSDRCRHVRHL